jgi:hypothetical protein
MTVSPASQERLLNSGLAGRWRRFQEVLECGPNHELLPPIDAYSFQPTSSTLHFEQLPPSCAEVSK